TEGTEASADQGAPAAVVTPVAADVPPVATGRLAGATRDLPQAAPVSDPPPSRAAPPSPRPRRFSLWSVLAVVAAATGLIVVALVGAYLVTRPTGPDDPAPAFRPDAPRDAAANRQTAPVPALGESYVAIQVLDTGDIVVHQRIRAAEPLGRLRLTTPSSAPGVAPMSATRVRVLADGSRVDGPDRLTEQGVTYVFDRTTDLDVRYRLAGAVQLSDSVDGRALALATSLDVRYTPVAARETRVVSAPRVLSLACSSSAGATPVPCGEALGDDSWQVDLSGRQVTQRVLAQLDIE
ncbi:MAG TPA: hypothetical protein VGV65_00510, partial [Nocardioides sp.]|nr:hypothetical protein [Nocardioides sp.]